MKPSFSLVQPALKLLAYGALVGTALVEAGSGPAATTMLAVLGAAALKSAGTLAGEVSGALSHDLLFGEKNSHETLTHKTIIDVTGEAIGRSLTGIAHDLLQSDPDNEGLDKLSEFLRARGVSQLQQRWHSLITEQIKPQLGSLSDVQVRAHLDDGALLQVSDLAKLVAVLTTDEKDPQSYLDDETIQQVSFCLLQTLPASFADVLTDDHSGKVYRQRLLEMLSELKAGQNEIRRGIEELKAGQKDLHDKVSPAQNPIPQQSPAPPRDFTGRDDELTEWR